MKNLKKLISLILIVVLSIANVNVIAAGASPAGTVLHANNDGSYDEKYGEGAVRPSYIYDGDMTTAWSPLSGWDLNTIQLNEECEIESVSVITNVDATVYGNYNMTNIYASLTPAQGLAWAEDAGKVKISGYKTEQLSDGNYKHTYDFSATPGPYKCIGFETYNHFGEYTEENPIPQMKIYEVEIIEKKERPDTIAGRATVYDNGMNSKSDSVYGTYEARFINLVDGDMTTYFSAVSSWIYPALVFDKAYDVATVEIIANATGGDNMNKCFYTTDGSMASGATSTYVTIKSTTDLGNGTYRIIYDFSSAEGEITSISFEPYNFAGGQSQFKMYELNVVEERTITRPDTIAGRATVYDNGAHAKADAIYGKYQGRFENLVDGEMTTYFSAVTGWSAPALVFDKAYDVATVEIISNSPITSDNMNKCFYTTDESMATGATSTYVTIKSTTDLGNGTYRVIYDFSSVEGKITSIAFEQFPFSAYNESTGKYQPSQIKMYELNVVEKKQRPDTIAGRATVYDNGMNSVSDSVYGAYEARFINLVDGDMATYFSAVSSWIYPALVFDKAYDVDSVEIIANMTGGDNMNKCFYTTDGSMASALNSYVTVVSTTDLGNGTYKMIYDFSAVEGKITSISFEPYNFAGGQSQFKMYELNVVEKPEYDKENIAQKYSGSILRARYNPWDYTHGNIPAHLFDNDVTTVFQPLNTSWDNVSVEFASASKVAFIRYITTSDPEVVKYYDMLPYVSNVLGESNAIDDGKGNAVRLNGPVSRQLPDGRYEIYYTIPDEYKDTTFKYAGFVSHDFTKEYGPKGLIPNICEMEVYTTSGLELSSEVVYENNEVKATIKNLGHTEKVNIITAIKTSDGVLKSVDFGDVITINHKATSEISRTVDTTGLSEGDKLEAYIWYAGSLKPVCGMKKCN